MKYRECNVPAEVDISPESIPAKDTEKWQTETYQLKVITPIHGGGVKAGEPDPEMPIRAAEIRGQLRYWWRFLYMNDPENQAAKEANKSKFYKDLFKKEREIWGGMADAKELEAALKKGKDFSSKVFIRILEINHIKKPEFCCTYKPKYKNGRPELNRQGEQLYQQPKFTSFHDTPIPQYAMFPGQGKSPSANDYNPDVDQPHKILPPDLTFTMQISFSGVSKIDSAKIDESVNWWINFGGIGARTRRGLGSLECMDSTCEKPTLEKEDVEKYGCVQEKIDATSAMDAWSKAIKQLQLFRQGVGYGRNQKKESGGTLVYYDQKKKYPAQGGSRWPEPDSIREIVNTYSKLKKGNKNKVICNDHKPTHLANISFPRAAFGLPIIFKFNNKDENCGDPKQSELRPSNSERMSSPLILKAMKTTEGYKAIALKLPFDQSNLILELKDVPSKPSELTPEKEQEWEDKKWDQWSTNWWNPSKSAQVDPIKNNKGTNNATDALTAFMNFFPKGGKK